MSYHVLHIFDYGCKLYKERGFLVCRKDANILGKIAIEDLRAVVLANEAVSISGNLMAELSAVDAVIIHCKNFKPVGISVPLFRTYDARVILNQSSGNKNLNAAIWRRLLYSKIENCIRCLELIGKSETRLNALIKNSELNEGLCAKEYWNYYFPELGEYNQIRNTQTQEFGINTLLNYGYGIMSAIVHRGIIVSGLNTLLGVNHKTYYRNTPLVFDVVEPFRAFVDFALYEYTESCENRDIKSWAIFFGKFLKSRRVKRGRYSLKLLDSVDVVCESLANAYRYKKADNLWLPIL